MILVDTSIWVEYVRRGNEILVGLLDRELVSSHPFVIGEVALGGFKPEIVSSLRKLPCAVIASDDIVLSIIQRDRFSGRGIGYVDAHLLVSARLTADTKIWTADRKLRSLADELGLSASFEH